MTPTPSTERRRTGVGVGVGRDGWQIWLPTSRRSHPFSRRSLLPVAATKRKICWKSVQRLSEMVHIDGREMALHKTIARFSTPLCKRLPGKGAAAVCIYLHLCCSGIAQENLQSVSSVKGECKVELNRADAQCDGILVYSHFRNGRDLLDFAGRAIAVVGFAGLAIEQTSNKHSVLWVDHVYINKNMIGADGQCAIDVSQDLRMQWKLILAGFQTSCQPFLGATRI
jgi:hypothetical protein